MITQDCVCDMFSLISNFDQPFSVIVSDKILKIIQIEFHNYELNTVTRYSVNLKLKNIAIIAVLASVAMFFIVTTVSVVGLCFFGVCDKEISITVMDYPTLVKYEQWFNVDFAVTNTGKNTIQNCVIHFTPYHRIIDQILSSSFSIESGETLDKTIKFSGFKRGNPPDDQLTQASKQMTAWVECDDIESHRIQFETQIDYPTIFEQIGDNFSSEKP